MALLPSNHRDQPSASAPDRATSGSPSLKSVRFNELDAEFIRQSKRLARMVSKLKGDISHRLR